MRKSNFAYLAFTTWCILATALPLFASSTANRRLRSHSGQPCHVNLDRETPLSLPGRAFSLLSTSDGCWVFASLDPHRDGSGGGLAVIDLRTNVPTLARTITPPTGVKKLAGMALTHDGKYLILGAVGRMIVYDVHKLLTGDAEPLVGEYRPTADQPPAYFEIAISADDKYVFAGDHNGHTVAVINFDATRSTGFARFKVVGEIPVGYGAGSVVLSRDGRRLYVTSGVAHDDSRWEKVCRAPFLPPTAPMRSNGTVQVVDVSRAVTDPAGAVLGTVPAGCDTVRLILDSAGKFAYVSSRTDDQLLVFDLSKLAVDAAHARTLSIPTRTGPVGLAFLDSRHVAVANALRFSGGKKDTEGVSIFEIGHGSNQPKLVKSVESAGPVDIAVLPDHKTLSVANYEPERVTFFPVRALLMK